jgi:methionyl-tRNA formyltransferase
MDAGGILAQERLPLNGRETTATLSEAAAEKSAAMLPAVLRALAGGAARERPQTGEPSFCSLIKKEDGRIDWNRSAAEIDAQIRAYTPWPLSCATHNNQTLYLLEAKVAETKAADQMAPGAILAADKQQGILIQTGDGILAVTRLQYQAKKPLPWKDFLNGARGFTGSRLS